MLGLGDSRRNEGILRSCQKRSGKEEWVVAQFDVVAASSPSQMAAGSRLYVKLYR